MSIDRLWNLLRRAEDEMTKMAIKHVINILEEEKRSIWFSSLCRKVFRGERVGITDLDKIMVINGKTKALIEWKFRREDFRRVAMFNAFQFITLRDLAKRSGFPLYYIVEMNEYGDRWFRVVDVGDVEFRVRRLGNGHSKDFYVVIDLDKTILMNELEFKLWLREVMV